jgi:hypothetical protein
VVSILLCALSVIFGIWEQDGFMIGLSVTAVLLAVLSFIYCSGSVQRYSVIMSLTVLICTALMVTAASYDSLVGGGAISELGWIFVVGIIHGVAVIPMILMFFFTVAAAFKASYNWVTVPGLGWLVGMGMILFPYVLILVFQRAELEVMINNSTLVITAFVGMLMFIAFLMIIRSVFRKCRYLITDEGLKTPPYHLREGSGDPQNVAETIDEAKERRIAWTFLIVTPLTMVLLFMYVTLGYAGGLAAGHDMIYLQMTCILWGIIMAVPPALRLSRLVALPLWFMAILYADMYMYSISLCHGMYFNLWWWANFTHVISSMVVTAIIFMALCLVQSRSPPHLTLGSRGGSTAMLIMAGLSFGVIWEIMEGYTGILTSVDYMSYGAEHTLENLGADLIGTIIMAVIAFIMLSKHTAEAIASKIRIGRKNIDASRKTGNG